MGVARIVLGIAFVLLVVGFLEGAAARGVGDPPPPTEVNLVFPTGDLTRLDNATALAAALAQALGLPSVDSEQTIVNRPDPAQPSRCCLFDWARHSVATTNETDALVATHGGPWITLRYSQSEKFMGAEVAATFGGRLASIDPGSMFQRLEDVAARLGIPLGTFGRVSRTGSPAGSNVPTVAVALVANYSGAPVAYGNELQMTFDVDRGLATGFAIFPWFSPSRPNVAPSQAFTAAVDYLNGTLAGKEAVFQGGTVYPAFDSSRYAFVYQVEARFVPTGPSSPWAGDYRVWVDANSGEIVFSTTVPPPPSLPPPSPWGVVVAVGVLVASGAGAGVVVHYFEPAKMKWFSLLVPLYLRLSKGSALEHFVRGQVYGYIASHPGASYSEIRDAFFLTNGTTTYHLAVLHTLGFVNAETEGRYKRFYPAGSTDRPLGHKLSDLQYRILEAVRRSGAATPSEVAREIGISRQRAAYNLRRMSEYGLISEREGSRGAYQTVAAEKPTPDTLGAGVDH